MQQPNEKAQNDPQNFTQETKDNATRTLLKTGCELRGSGTLDRNYPQSDPQNFTQEAKDQATRTLLKTGCELRGSGTQDRNYQ